MNTILVGDLHLTAQVVLPMVENKLEEYNCNRIVLLGDYMDAYDQTENLELYMNELDYLLMWKSRMQQAGIEVITLIGNHDVPYLTNSPKIYSLRDDDGFISVRQKLLELGIQVAFKLNDYIVSHAGYTKDYELEDWHLSILDERDLDKIYWLETHVGIFRGGQYISGSPLWADFQELSLYPNMKYPKQIVGHTPQNKITIVSEKMVTFIGIDTFTIIPIKRSPYYRQAGSGEILLHKGDSIVTISLDWENDKVIEMIDLNFYRSKRIATIQGITFDFGKWSIIVEDEEVFLTNKEFDVCVYLFEKGSQSVSIDEINKYVLSKYVFNDSVEKVLSRLMSKIELIKKNSNNEYTFKN